MKTRTVKNLGTAALGVAFAAVAAGSATAAVPAVPGLGGDPAAMAQGVLGQLPLDAATKVLPGGPAAGGATAQAVRGSLSAVPAAAGHALPQAQGLTSGGKKDSRGNAGLLGGLPIGDLPIG